jgi:hypothetical protein
VVNSLLKESNLDDPNSIAGQRPPIFPPIGSSKTARINRNRAPANNRQDRQASITAPTGIDKSNARLSTRARQCYFERSTKDARLVDRIDIDAEWSSNNRVVSFEDQISGKNDRVTFQANFFGEI